MIIYVTGIQNLELGQTIGNKIGIWIR